MIVQENEGEPRNEADGLDLSSNQESIQSQAAERRRFLNDSLEDHSQEANSLGISERKSPTLQQINLDIIEPSKEKSLPLSKLLNSNLLPEQRDKKDDEIEDIWNRLLGDNHNVSKKPEINIYPQKEDLIDNNLIICPDSEIFDEDDNKDKEPSSISEQNSFENLDYVEIIASFQEKEETIIMLQRMVRRWILRARFRNIIILSKKGNILIARRMKKIVYNNLTLKLSSESYAIITIRFKGELYPVIFDDDSDLIAEIHLLEDKIKRSSESDDKLINRLQDLRMELAFRKRKRNELLKRHLDRKLVIVIKNASNILKNACLEIDLKQYEDSYSRPDALINEDNLRDIANRLIEFIYVEDGGICFTRNLCK